MSTGLNILIAVGFFVVLAGGLVVAGLAMGLSGGGEVQERMLTYAALPEETRQTNPRRRAGLARLRRRLNNTLSVFTSEELSLQLMSANWPVTGLEYTLIRIGALLLGLLLGWLVFRSPVSGLGIGVIVFFIPGILLQRSVNRRRLAFGRQLVDLLVLINGAVRAGFSLLQAIEVVGKEMKAPASEEFQRVQREVGLGLSLNEALENLSRRMENSDLTMMVTAVKIHSQVGGNLATMLTAVTETIRDRVRLLSEVRVLTTQQRYTSYLLSVLPIIMGAVLFVMNQEYMLRLFQPGFYCIPIGALVGILVGQFAIRRVGRIEV